MPAIAAFFHHIGVGMLFCPSIDLFGKRVECQNDFHFIKEVKERYGIPLRGLIYDASKHAFKFIADNGEESKISVTITRKFEVKKLAND